MRSTAAWLLIASCPVLVACGSRSLVSDWTRSLDETRSIKHAAVPLEAREGRLIDLVEDLVIEDRDDGSAYDFDVVVDLVVDDAGNILVQDGRNRRIQVFDSDGRFVRSIGGKDSAHSPFAAGWMALSGRRLAISTGQEIAVWSVDGDYLYDRPLMSRALYRPVHGTADGSVIGAYQIYEGRQPLLRLDKLPLDAESSTTLGVVPDGAPGRGEVEASAGFAVTESGEVFLTAGDDYQILAVTTTGDRLFTLSVDWPRLRVREEGTPADMSILVELPSSGPAELTLAPALATDSVLEARRVGYGAPLRADGHDHIYVFPYVSPDTAGDLRPVDVYSTTGERLFAGLIPERSWVRAKGNFIYGIEMDEKRKAQRVVRYRLVEPFE